ncbi:MAG: NosD domain-containing protein [Thermoleophilaceae bacterium]
MRRVPWTLRAFACVLASASAVAFSASEASAATGGCTKVTAPSGSDSAPGTAAAPFRTVQKLVDSLSPGQTGCLRAGSYSENVEVRSGGTSTARLRVTAYPGEKATLVGEFEVHKGAPYVVVDHLYLNGRTADRVSPIVNAHDVTFRNDDVTNDHTGICFLLGDSNGEWGRADRARIESNRIHDCGRRDTELDHGIYVEASTGAVIQGNWIYDNSDFGVHLYPDAQRAEVRGNVIDGNGMGVTFSGDGGQASSNNRVEGNVLANSRKRWNVESWWGGSATGRGNVARANCLYASSRSSYYNEHGGVTTSGGGFTSASNRIANPRYENGSANDFRLAAGSGCRAVFYGDPSAVPGPDGSVHAASTPRLRPSVRLAAARHSVRRGQRVRLRGRVSRSSIRPGQRVLLYVRAGSHRRLVGRVRVSRAGRFVARPRVASRARRLRFRAVVPRVGRSRAVRVRVRA